MQPVSKPPSPTARAHRATVPPRRRALLAEGLAAGAVLALFDWLATGVERVTPSLLAAILAWGLLCGLAAGAVAALLRRRGAGLGLVVLAGGLLHATSTYTKSIGPVSGAGSVVALAFASLLCALAAFVAARSLALKGGLAWPALVLAAIPLASLLWAAVPHSPLALGITCALPLCVALLWTWGPPAWSGAVGLALTACGLLAPSLARQVEASELLPPVAGAQPVGPPNIVLFVVDTLRADHAFPAQSQAAPPALARLAREGVRFDQAVASATWTLPSISSLMTSLHPSQHGAVRRDLRLPDDAVTLAELLRAEGYQTAAFTGGGFVGPAFGLDQGFEYFDPLAEYEVFQFPRHIPLVWRVLKNRWFPARTLVEQLEHEYGGAAALREHVLAWLRERDQERPFFLFVHTFQVHDYFLFDPDCDGPLPRASTAEVSESVDPSKLIDATQQQLDWCHSVYRRRVEIVDRELDQLIRGIELDAGPGGLVGVLTSDHGEGFDAERRRVHHGARLHDDLLRVPLVMWAPGRLASGRTIAEQVQLLDVLPTVLELAGLTAPTAIAGRSLLPLVDSADPTPRVAWSEDHILGHQRALRTETWKAVEFESKYSHVYRLDLDPLEDSPFTPGLPAELAQLWDGRKALLEVRAAEASQEDEALTRQLQRLGY